MKIFKKLKTGFADFFSNTSLLAYQVNILLRNTLPITLMVILMSVTYGWILWEHVHHLYLSLWMGSFFCISIIRIITVALFHKKKSENKNYRLYIALQIFTSLISGLTMGLTIYMLPPGFSFLHIYVLIMIIAMMAGAVSSLAANIYAFLSYFLPLFLLFLGRLLYSLYLFPENQYITGMVLLFFTGPLVLIRFALESNRVLTRSYNMYMEKDHLLQQLEKEKEQLKLSEIVLKNINEAVMITDAKNKIIKVNNAFTDFTGYSSKEVIGKNPSILKSKKHGSEFYREMWKAIEVKGSWSGEIWNKRKNREIYPELLNIVVLRNHNGEITHHIGNFMDISNFKRREHELNYLAHYDLLTGLPNRRSLYEYLDNNLSNLKEQKETLAILFMDLNLFKNINDLHGHNVGDLLLNEIATRLKETLREEDKIARLGGDEFAIIVKNESKKNISLIAKNIIKKIEKPFVAHDITCTIGVSIGIALAPENGIERVDLMHKADQTMYKAKKAIQNKKTKSSVLFYK